MRIRNYDMLTNHGNIEGRKILADIMEAGLSAADPYANTRALTRMEGSKLIFEGSDFEPEGDPRSGPAIFDLEKIDRVYVFGFGKGIQSITKAIEELLGDYLTDGHVVAKHGDDIIMEKIGVTLAGHPVPDKFCVEGCQKIVQIIEEAKLTANDLVITAVGNGVSALMTLPWPGLPIEDLTETTRLMQIEYGVNTGDLNQIRINTDQLKGGRISRMIHPAQMVHLLGVEPNNISLLRRFPGLSEYETLLRHNGWLHTLCVSSSYKAALDVIEKFDINGKMPRSIINFLQNFDPQKESVKWTEFESFNFRVFGVMPQSRSPLVEGMRRASELGYIPYYLGTIGTEAAPAGRFMAQIATAVERGTSSFKAPCAIFRTGELSVTCGDNPGVGGRNQEYCLSGSLVIAGSKRIVMASIDTDGTDGPGGHFHPDATALDITCLTGGIVDGQTAESLTAKGITIYKVLQTHSTSAALWEAGSGIAAIQNISLNDLGCTIIMDHDG